VPARAIVPVESGLGPRRGPAGSCVAAALKGLLQRRRVSEAATGRFRRSTAYTYRRAWVDLGLFLAEGFEGWARATRGEREDRSAELLGLVDARLEDLAVEDVQAWVEAMLAKPMRDRDGRPKVGLEGSTVNVRLAALAHLCKVAIRMGLRDDSPADHVQIARRRVSHRYRREGPTLEELRALIESIPTEQFRDHRDRVLITLLGFMGLRREEASELRADAFAQARDGGFTVGLLRKEDRSQTLLVPRHLEAPIREYVERWNLSEWLFPVEPGGPPLAPHTVSQIVRTRTQSGLGTRYSSHALRHTFVTAALDAGASLADVQRYAGHADPRTTVTYRDERLTRETCPAELLGD
jgi:site-specific recombinase XerD